MKLLIGIEVNGYAQKQLPKLQELAKQFADSLPHQISIKSAHIEIFKEASGGVPKQSTHAPKSRRAQK